MIVDIIKESKVTRGKGKRINTPFGYFGSKNRIGLLLSEKLPPHNCWVEVFCGSAALTLRKAPAPIEIINDIDGEIINFFEQLRDNLDELCRLVELTPYAEQELINARANGIKFSNVERARRFLIQSMMAINGVFGDQPGGFSYSDSYSRNGHDARVNRWNNLPDRLRLVAQRLKNVRVENKDARRLLKRYSNRPATLVYLDPPYFVQRTKGYKMDSFDINFHSELLELANHAKCMVFISGYDNDLYNDLLLADDGWHKKELKTHTKDSKGNAHERTEVLWMNKYFTKALNENKVPIKLSKKEKTQNKVNPIRKK
jgi:DNA adenine methylase